MAHDEQSLDQAKKVVQRKRKARPGKRSKKQNPWVVARLATRSAIFAANSHELERMCDPWLGSWE